MNDREKLSMAIARLLDVKQDMQALLGSIRGAGPVYVKLTDAIDGLIAETARIDKRTVVKLLESDHYNSAVQWLKTHKAYCNTRYGGLCNCEVSQCSRA